jgi:chorismate mutase
MTVTTPEVAEAIGAERARIDAIDDAILDLLQQRRDASQRIQALRTSAGGARVEHARENAILRHWTERLGPVGGELALDVLALCRGRRP